jgi:thiol:disulfide interchange protein DsbA
MLTVKLALGFFAGCAFLLLSGQLKASGYAEVDKPAPLSPGSDHRQVEVVFWYGCRYCFSIEDDIRQMQSDLDGQADVSHLPAPLNKTWANHARLYYMIESYGLPWSVHEKAYRKVIESDGKDLATKGQIVDFLIESGISRQSASELYRSDEIIDSVRNAYLKLKAYGVSVTPTIVIDGRWLVDGYTASGVKNILPITEEILDRK